MTALSQAIRPASPIRWNLVISDQTNVAVRSFLAQRGFKKGDLSNFVEEAVRWRVLDQTIEHARTGFDSLAVSDAQNMLDEALANVRADGLRMGVYAAFEPPASLGDRKQARAAQNRSR